MSAPGRASDLNLPMERVQELIDGVQVSGLQDRSVDAAGVILAAVAHVPGTPPSDSAPAWVIPRYPIAAAWLGLRERRRRFSPLAYEVLYGRFTAQQGASAGADAHEAAGTYENE